MTKTKEKDRAKDQAACQLESIIEMVDALETAKTDRDREAVEQTIHEDPLSVEVRGGWYTLDHPENGAELAEYRILLCTGGPAVRIVGDLTEHGEPESARIEYQAWGTPWTDFPIDNDQEEKLLTYCRQFYFGE